MVPLAPRSQLSSPPTLPCLQRPHLPPPRPPQPRRDKEVCGQGQLASLEQTEMASGYSLCRPTRGGRSPAPRQPPSNLDKDVSQDRDVAPVGPRAGMARREASFELLGVRWPEPEDRMAQGRPPAGGARERPWRRQRWRRRRWWDEAPPGRLAGPPGGLAQRQEGLPVAQSSCT